MDFKNKIVIVTGSSRGIGAAIAKAFAGEGASVIVNYLQNADAAARPIPHANREHRCEPYPDHQYTSNADPNADEYYGPKPNSCAISDCVRRCLFDDLPGWFFRQRIKRELDLGK